MEIRRRHIGVAAALPSHPAREVEEYVLNDPDGLSISVWNYGATLVEVLVPDARGRRTNVVVRLPTLADYEDRSGGAYLGATLGRFARSVRDGRLEIDGVEHHLDRNEGGHHIHGGPIGFDRLVWDAEADRRADALELRLRLRSPDGDQGYPGEVTAETTYRVGPGCRLEMEHRAVTTRPTLLAMTNHAAWNLAGAGSVDGHLLTIHAALHLRVDAGRMPTGDLDAVAGTTIDFRSSRPIGATAIDDSFVLDRQDPAAELIDRTTGRVMRITTDQSGMQVYTGDHLRPCRAGIFLQTGAWPDAPSHGQFPSARLDPGEVYRHRTTHSFTTET